MAIIGNGDIANAIIDRKGFTFFACGVSDSKCISEAEFERERYALQKARAKNKKNRLVYFSTLSIYHKDTPYTNFKREQEAYIKKWCEPYCIIRLGNITWGKNPHTIINTFKRNIEYDEPVRINKEFKYLCTKDELNYWLSVIPDFNTEMNITGERVSVQEIYLRIKNGLL